ncbi:phage major capsid protein [Nguyenibacter vanlangensis]|uniref:Phage major capsid protein n=1 Tax=Nguyenibacter vanlangensis TaxID=1216886 RepID=A0ABZ3D1Q7_9PROT
MTVQGVDRDARTVDLAFSSERAEVPRWFGTEVLGHEPGEVRMDRLNDGAPMLVSHDIRDQVGIVERASIDADRVGRATVRFGKSARASEIFDDIADGIRKHVSVGYRVHGMRLAETRDNGATEVYRITDWEPTEISTVPVPADHSVGIGRDLSPVDVPKSENIVDDITPIEQTGARATTHMTDITEQERQAAIDAERARVNDILDLGRQYNATDMAMDHARNPNASVSDFQRALLERTGKSAPVPPKTSDVGMTRRDMGKYSIVRAIRALADPANRRAQDDAGFEREVGDEARKHQRNSDSGNFVIPSDVLRHAVDGTRDMNAGTNGQTGAGSTGGATIQTSLLASSYIDILRNKAIFTRGISMLGGLVGNIEIPKQTATTQGYWIGEGDAPTTSNMDFGQVKLSPNTVAAYTDITRRLIMQSSMDVEALVRRDLAIQMGLTIDSSGYYGSGTGNQPQGLKGLTGIGAMTFAAAQPSYAEIVEMETTIALANADAETMMYKARADFRGYAKQTLKFPGVNGSATIWEPGDTVNGYRCPISQQIATGDLFMGNWSDIIMGMWGGLELMVDPYSNSTSGGIRVVTFQDIDWACRQTAAFVVGSKPAA